MVEFEVEIVPSCIVVPAGYRLGLWMRGRDYEYRGRLDDYGERFVYATRGTGGMTHADPDDRPPEVFDAVVTLHIGPGSPCSLLLPVIPEAGQLGENGTRQPIDVGRAPLTSRAATHGAAVAVIDSDGDHTYDELLALSGTGAAALLGESEDLAGARVCFMVTPGWRYVAWQWAIWRAGGVAVPLCLTHPAPELAFVLDDARPIAVVVGKEFESMLGPLVAERGIA